MPATTESVSVDSYVQAVISGEVTTAKLTRLAVERYLCDLESGPQRGLHFDPNAAEYALEFFTFLKHSKGEWAGQPFTLAPWQQFIIWNLFGWKRADGSRRFRIAYAEIAYDRWNASSIVTELMNDGAKMVPCGQGFASMSAPAKELEKLVLGQQIAHGGHPILRWNASNVTTRQDPAGNIKIDKAKSTEKVDGIVAFVMAIGRAMVHDGSSGKSVYETRGVLVFG